MKLLAINSNSIRVEVGLGFAIFDGMLHGYPATNPALVGNSGL